MPQKLKSTLILVLKICVTLGLISLVLRNITQTPGLESEHFMALLHQTHWSLIGTAFVLLLLSMFLGAFQWQLLLRRQKIDLSYSTLVQSYFTGLFFNNFMPGNVGGDVKKIMDIRTLSGGKTSEALSATAFDRFLSFLLLNCLALGVWLLFFRHDPRATFLVVPSLWIFTGFCVFFAGVLSRRFGRALERFLHFLRIPARLISYYVEMRDKFHAYREPRFFFRAFALSGIIQLLRVLVHFCCGLAIGVGLNMSWYLYLVPMIALVSALPISIGGFGPRELLAQSLFAQVGVGHMESVVIQFLAYAVGLLISLTGGVLYILKQMQPKEKALAN